MAVDDGVVRGGGGGRGGGDVMVGASWVCLRVKVVGCCGGRGLGGGRGGG